METLLGKRIYFRWPMSPGEYCRRGDVWFAVPPEVGFPVARLDEYNVIEHEDNTISVTDLMLMVGLDGKKWSGYLEKGIWRKK